MPPADQSTSPGADSTGPVPFLATAAALQAIDEALRAAQHEVTGTTETHDIGTDQALASLLLLRQVRKQLAGWETGLIETARHAGAGWADLAHPLNATHPDLAAQLDRSLAAPGLPAPRACRGSSNSQ